MKECLYQIKIYDRQGQTCESTKAFVGSYTSWKRKDVPGLGERLEKDQLLESDLFVL
jgi:hypothetical protein